MQAGYSLQTTSVVLSIHCETFLRYSLFKTSKFVVILSTSCKQHTRMDLAWLITLEESSVKNHVEHITTTLQWKQFPEVVPRNMHNFNLQLLEDANFVLHKTTMIQISACAEFQAIIFCFSLCFCIKIETSKFLLFLTKILYYMNFPSIDLCKTVRMEHPPLCSSLFFNVFLSHQWIMKYQFIILSQDRSVDSYWKKETLEFVCAALLMIESKLDLRLFIKTSVVTVQE